MMLGKAAAEGRNINLQQQAVFARHGNDCQRQKGEIGFASLRGGDMIFDHTVIFAGDKERIELSHKSISRDIYAKGAIKAALWAKDKPNGFYSMQDVLFGPTK
jgi:4-hydroxy-tetrahydrodipicolinate reductase